MFLLSRLCPRRAPLGLVLLALSLIAGACSSGTIENRIAAADAQQRASQSDTNDPTVAVDSGSQDPNNPWVLGWRATGEPGATIGGTITYIQGADELEQSATRVLSDEGEYWTLQTGWVDGLRLDITATSPGPTTVELYIGRLADPEDPFFGGQEVRNIIQEVTLNEGESVVLEGTRPTS